jgi:hypothetical protein
VARPKKSTQPNFLRIKNTTPLKKYFSIGKFLTWLYYIIPRGHWAGDLNTSKYFEFGIRNSGHWLRAPHPEAFATALDEDPGLWCVIIAQLLAESPSFLTQSSM